MKIVNFVTEQYLRTYINYQQYNCVHFLPMAKFAANNQDTERTDLSSFFATYDFNPKMDFESDIQTNNPEEQTA